MAVSASVPVASNSAIEKVSGFFGREAELGWLLRLWNDTAIRDKKGERVGPRLAILIAETGLGKSRLVQALYQLLTTDPFWNPSDKNYWPDNIVSNTGQILVNPEFDDDYVPDGPPKFLWLGGRWQETKARNPEERRCIIPALRDMLAVHVAIAERHRTTWQRLRTSAEKTIKSEGPDIAKDKLLDLTGIPYAGLVLKLMRAGISARNAPTTVGDAIQKQQQDAADVLLEEMREVFGGFGGGGLVLPTILWLDDAHWIDPMTLRFLHKLWKEATEKRWPLLIIITHWEQEWNKLGLEATGESLLALAMQPGSEKLILTKAPVADIEARLNQKLPGLLPAQRASMLEKSAGNFLTLEENVGELISDPENFVDQQVDGPLAPAGEDLVATWASERQTRIHDRFLAMKPKPTLQQLLAWASRVGIQFPQGVPADFAIRRQGGSPLDRRQLLKSCMEPYAVLGTPSPNFLEFRDRAYYAEGAEYFRRHLAQKDETELLVTLRATLADWINGAFDENGNVHLTEDQKISVSAQNTDQFTSFTKDERRAILEIALRELPLPSRPDWTNAHHQAALRAILVYLETAGQDRLWPAVSLCALRLSVVRWEEIPVSLASTEFLVDIGHSLTHASMSEMAVPVLEQILARREKETQRSPEWAKTVSGTLGLLAMLNVERGSFDEAEQLMLRSLKLIEQTFGPCDLQVVTPLIMRGRVLINMYRYREAEEGLRRAESICERISRESAFSPEDSTIPILQCLLGVVCLKTHRVPQAEEFFRLALKAMEGRSDPDDVAVVLNYLGEALLEQDHPKEAEPFHRRAIEIIESSLGTESRNLGIALEGLAFDLHEQGKTKDAIPFMVRSCEILEKALGPATPSLAISLANLANLYYSQGDENQADPLASRALKIIEGLFGPDHLMMAKVLGGLAESLVTCGQLKSAEILYTRAIQIMESCPDPSDQPLWAAYHKLGLLQLADGRHSEADTSFERAMKFSENSLGPDHPLVAKLLENRAVLYRELGKYDLAEAVSLRAQRIRDVEKKRSTVPFSGPVGG